VQMCHYVALFLVTIFFCSFSAWLRGGLWNGVEDRDQSGSTWSISHNFIVRLARTYQFGSIFSQVSTGSEEGISHSQKMSQVDVCLGNRRYTIKMRLEYALLLDVRLSKFNANRLFNSPCEFAVRFD